jgi:hypothetical protein
MGQPTVMILTLAAMALAGCAPPQPYPEWYVYTSPGGDPDKIMQCSTNPYAWGAAPPTCGGPAGRTN